jgi:hypothetical protein
MPTVPVPQARIETAAVQMAKAEVAERELLHLASYKARGAEQFYQEGWKKLVAQYPVLASAEPTTKVVTIPGKGTFTRLYAALPKGTAGSACSVIRAKGGYCDTLGA